MMQATNSNQQELDGGLQNILSNIIQEQVDSMVSEMTAKVSEELKDLLDQAMEGVKETWAAWPSRCSAARKRTRAPRRC